MHLTKSAHGTRIPAIGKWGCFRFGIVMAAIAFGAPLKASARTDEAAGGWPGVSAPPSPLVADWASTLLELLRRMYQFLGGNPYDLSPDPALAMTQFTASYAAHGVPAGLTNEQRAAGRADVEAAYPLVPSTTLTGLACRAALRSMYEELGGNPNNL